MEFVIGMTALAVALLIGLGALGVGIGVDYGIYIFSSLLVPANPADVSSWRKYFFGVRVPFFASGVLLVSSILLSNQTLLGVSPLHPTQIGLYACLAIFAIGTCSGNARLHNVLALMPPLMIAWVLVEMAQPEWSAR